MIPVRKWARQARLGHAPKAWIGFIIRNRSRSGCLMKRLTAAGATNKTGRRHRATEGILYRGCTRRSRSSENRCRYFLVWRGHPVSASRPSRQTNEIGQPDPAQPNVWYFPAKDAAPYNEARDDVISLTTVSRMGSVVPGRCVRGVSQEVRS